MITITPDFIIKFAALLTAVATIYKVFAQFRDWQVRQEEQDKKIASIQEEQCLLVYGLLACLKGLQEQGCNGPVTEAVGKIEKHINKQAHEVE